MSLIREYTLNDTRIPNVRKSKLRDTGLSGILGTWMQLQGVGTVRDAGFQSRVQFWNRTRGLEDLATTRSLTRKVCRINACSALSYWILGHYVLVGSRQNGSSDLPAGQVATKSALDSRGQVHAGAFILQSNPEKWRIFFCSLQLSF